MKKMVMFLLIFSLVVPSFTFAEDVVEDFGEAEIVPMEKEDIVEITNDEIKEITKDGRNYYETKNINEDIWGKYNVLAYGNPFGDKKGEESRYLGKTPDAQDITNHKFPHDAWNDSKSLDSRDWIEFPWDSSETKKLGASSNAFNNNPDYEQSIIRGMKQYYGGHLTGEKKDWYKSVQILQPPTKLSWGLGRMWHRTPTKIFYITIPIAPLYNLTEFQVIHVIEDELGETIKVEQQKDITFSLGFKTLNKAVIVFPLISPKNVKFKEWNILDDFIHEPVTWDKVESGNVLSKGKHPFMAVYPMKLGEVDKLIVYARYVEKEKTEDFSIEAFEEDIVAYKDEGNVTLSVSTLLTNSSKEIPTGIKLYKEGSQIYTESRTYQNEQQQTINLTISENILKLGENTFDIVINSDLKLSKAIPFLDEEDLTNNKAAIKVNYKEKAKNISGPCEFEGTADSKQYINKKLIPKTCFDKYGSYNCSYYICDTANPKTYSLERNSKVEFFKQEIFSDDWHRFAIKDESKNKYIGQEYGKKYNLPYGKNLKGNNATDELMSNVGFNPLRQVIQSGLGIQLKTNVKISGYIENFNDYIPESFIQNYIDDFRFNSTNVTGEASSPTIKNNNGDLLQKMEFDSSRSYEYKKDIQNIGSETYGAKDCKQVEVFKTEFEYEIPMIITKAKGTIDVIGGKKAPVPSESKWFVYLNNYDGLYQLGLQATLKPSLLGLGLPNTNCIDTPSNYKIGVNGTMFDNLNVDDGGGKGDWDN